MFPLGLARHTTFEVDSTPRVFAKLLEIGSHENCRRTSQHRREPPANMASQQMVLCFGKKRTATATAQCKAGSGLIKVYVALNLTLMSNAAF